MWNSSLAFLLLEREDFRVQLTVLVLDRDPLLLQSVGRILRPHRVLQATGGLLGLTYLRSGQRVDGVLAGVDLGGLTGPEVLMELSLEYPELATRFAFMAPHSAMLASEGVPILGRPPNPEALRAWTATLRREDPRVQNRRLYS